MKSKKEEVSVKDFMQTLDHPFKEEIEVIRKIVLKVDPKITEHIKWNGPSFCFNGDDRITFRLNPPKNIQLIFHRGAKVRTDVDDFSFDDSTGLIKWVTKDRGVVTFKDKNDLEKKKSDLKLVVGNWIRATVD
jgi:hypothetical protein